MPTFRFERVLSSIFRSVRPLLMPFYGNVKHRAKEGSRRHDRVTELDFRIEAHLKENLAREFPDISFVGEETGGDRTARRFWLTDPIDGTEYFIRGMPFCTTMLALIEDDVVTVGAIYDFVSDVLYYCERDRGAVANDVPIRVSTRPIEEAQLGYETHLSRRKNWNIFLKLRELCPLFHALCSGFDYAMIASGKLDGKVTFDPHGKDYDFAPGTLLVAEAGGIVRNIGSASYDYRTYDFIAANPKVYRALTEGEGALFPIIRS